MTERRRRGVAIGWKIGEVREQLQRAIAAAGGAEAVRKSADLRRRLLDVVEPELLRRADGRAARFIRREITRIVDPESVADLERAKQRRKWERRKRKLARVSKKRHSATRESARPACSICGSTSRLLSAGGECVNRSQCDRAAALGWKASG